MASSRSSTQKAAAAPAPAPAAETVCFESRKGASEVTKRDLQPGWPNVKCSPKTGAALWYGDPYDGTVPMGKMPGLEKIPEGHAVIKHALERSHGRQRLPGLGLEDGQVVGPVAGHAGVAPPHLIQFHQPGATAIAKGLCGAHFTP